MDNLVFQLNSLAFPIVIRGFFGPIVKFLYSMIEKAVDLMYKLVDLNFGLDSFVDEFTSTVFNILIIYMFFRLTISMLNYLINPDSFLDKNTGITKLVSRIIIAIVLLIVVNPMFTKLKNIETSIIDSDILSDLILNDNERYEIAGADNSNVYATKMSDLCPDDYRVYSMSKGAKFSVLALRPFYQPTKIEEVDDKEEFLKQLTEDNETIDGLNNYYCGTSVDNFTDLPSSAADLLSYNVYEDVVGDKDIFHEEDFVIDFSYIWALIVGIVIFLLIISYCFDVVIRTLTLFFYQIIAPIPIISYMSPNKKESDMLVNWAKKVMSVWFSLFLRIIVLDFILCFINIACNEIDTNGLGLIAQLFVIVGALMFAKKLPKLIEELFPGLKFGGLELNPFKRIQSEALGGGLINGAMGAAAGAAVTGIAGGVSNAIAFGRNRQNLKKQIDEAKTKGDNEKADKLKKRLDRMNTARFVQTATGGIAGGTTKGLRSGFNSGRSGTPLSAFKNVSGDIKKNNTARNNRTAIRDFNNDIRDGEIANAKAEMAKVKQLLVDGDISLNEYNSKMNDLNEKINNAKQQQYTWVDRNVIENVDKFAGVKNEYGGYGYYNEQIEDLTKKIDNQHQSEMAMRQALATKVSGQEVGYDLLEELRSKMAKANLNFNANIKDNTRPDFDAKTRAAFESIASNTESLKNIDMNKLIDAFDANKADLGGITNLDNAQKELKTERKNYQEMMDARQKMQDNNK